MNFLGWLEGLLGRLCERDKAVAGAIWVVREGRYPIRVASSNWGGTGLADSVELREIHAALIASLFHARSDDTVVLDPRGGFSTIGERENFNPTTLTIAAAPFTRGGTRIGIVELFFSANGGVNEESIKQLAFTARTCFESDVTFDLNSITPLPPPKEGKAMMVARSLMSLHNEPNIASTPIMLANEIRRIIGCSRTTVLLRRHGQLRIEAISGQERVDRTRASVQAIEILVEAVTPGGELFWWPSSKVALPPAIEDTLERCVVETDAWGVGIVPLRNHPIPSPYRSGAALSRGAVSGRPPTGQALPQGAIFCEWNTQSVDEDSRVWLRILAQHASIALTNASNQTRAGVGLNLLQRLGHWLTSE